MTCFTAEELRERARARLPRVAFDFMDGGAGPEDALRRNAEALRRLRMVPRVLVDTGARSPAQTLFGKTHALPIGAAPIGLANLVWPGTDVAVARAAAKHGLPYVLSSSGSTAIETIVAHAPEAWFQLYVGRDAAIVADLIDRAEAAGCPVLVVTVDIPAPGKRVRDLRNGFTLPLRPSWRGVLDLASHPAWSLATLRAGPPRFAALERYERQAAGALSLAALQASQISARLDWDELARIRDRWPRKLVVKGVLHPEDARRAAALGADGLVVSNHGGRQLASAPAPIDCLAAIRAAAGPEMAILVDGGFRSGEDICKGIALGADLVLLGRPFLYACGAMGPAGPEHLIALIADELDRAMAQLGCPAVADLANVLVEGAP